MSTLSLLARALAVAVAAGGARADGHLPCLHLGEDLGDYVEPLLAEGWTVVEGPERRAAIEGPALLLHAASVYPPPPTTPEETAARLEEATDFVAGRYPDSAVLTRGDATLFVAMLDPVPLLPRAVCLVTAPRLPEVEARLADIAPSAFGGLTYQQDDGPVAAGAGEAHVEAVRLDWSAARPEPLAGTEGLIVSVFALPKP